MMMRTTGLALVLAGAAWLGAYAPAQAARLDGADKPQFSLLQRVDEERRRGSGMTGNRGGNGNGGMERPRDVQRDGGHQGNSNGSREEMRKRFDSLPPEQQEKIRQRMKEHKAQNGQTHDDADDSGHRNRKEGAHEGRGDGGHQGNSKGTREEMRKRFDSLPPEQQEKIRQRMEEHKAQREQMKEKLMELPPEERKQKMQEMREKFQKNEEGSRSEHKQKFEERWKNSSPEQKQKFCENVDHKCAEGGGEGYGCKVAQTACGAQSGK